MASPRPGSTIFAAAPSTHHYFNDQVHSNVRNCGLESRLASSSKPHQDTGCVAVSTAAATAPSVESGPEVESLPSQAGRSESLYAYSHSAVEERHQPQSREPIEREQTLYGNTGGATLRPEHGEKASSTIEELQASYNGSVFVYNSYHGLTEEEQAQEDMDAAEQAEAGIIADQDTMTDAGYESDAATTASTSISSSVRDFSFENGRRYHRFREGRYNFPNDDVEQEREDMKHTMITMLCQQLHFAPIGDDPHEILDIGTGTGQWAIEVGEAYPTANVLGIDLSPIQPEWVPPNVRFLVDDVESPWLHPRSHFDFIHSRHTVMAIKDWETLMRRSNEHMKPGGWLELQEIYHFPMSANSTMLENHPVYQYWKHIGDGLGALGINFGFSRSGQISDLMRQCGYVNVTERIFHIPIGTWPKNRKLKSVGLYWKTILLDGCQAIALGPMTRGLKWSREQVEIFLVSVRRAYHDNSALMYMPFVVVYGQKPY